MDVKHIGLFLLHQRKKQQLTQKDVSLICNVSAQAVSKWERGESIPDIEALEKLSLLYNVSINEIIAGERNESRLDTTLRRNIVSLVLSILVFLVYLLPYATMETLEPFFDDTQLSVLVRGYEMVFNGMSGLLVVLAIMVFVTLLSHLFVNILFLLEIIQKQEYVINYLVITILFILCTNLFHLLLPGFYKMPQILLMLIMVGQLFLMVDQTTEVMRLPKRISTITKSLLRNWKVVISNTIYLFSIGFAIWGISNLIRWNFLVSDFNVVESILEVLLLILFVVWLIVLLAYYKRVYNQTEIKQVLPLIIVSAIPLFVFLTGTIVDLITDPNVRELQSVLIMLLVTSVCAVIPCNVYLSTKYIENKWILK